jgi:DNA-binding SARP family transcriptional activator
VPARVPPVRVYTLDGFRLEIGQGSEAAWTRTNSRPLLLLKLLIALGSEDVALDLLCEHLWGEAEGDHAHDAFHTTLRRLRRLIGRDAVRLQGGRLALRPEHCWVDAHALSTGGSPSRRNRWRWAVWRTTSLP